jgi:hypothetical protein
VILQIKLFNLFVRKLVIIALVQNYLSLLRVVHPQKLLRPRIVFLPLNSGETFFSHVKRKTAAVLGRRGRTVSCGAESSRVYRVMNGNVMTCVSQRNRAPTTRSVEILMIIVGIPKTTSF